MWLYCIYYVKYSIIEYTYLHIKSVFMCCKNIWNCTIFGSYSTEIDTQQKQRQFPMAIAIPNSISTLIFNFIFGELFQFVYRKFRPDLHTHFETFASWLSSVEFCAFLWLYYKFINYYYFIVYWLCSSSASLRFQEKTNPKSAQRLRKRTPQILIIKIEKYRNDDSAKVAGECVLRAEHRTRSVSISEPGGRACGHCGRAAAQPPVSIIVC